jgi:anti-sigma28 factor (negative regulator of flagellin synthesis)
MVDEIKAAGANFSASRIGRPAPYVRQNTSAPEQTGEITDRVEISALATLLSKYADMPATRNDLIAKVREQIKAGNYETPEKWDQAIDSLMEDLTT